MKRPAFQFYPGDWLRDAALRSCSVPARGLWIDMISLMHDGSPYGHLKVNSKVIGEQQLARMVGAAEGDVKEWLCELSDAGVLSKTEDGVICCRRMLRDEKLRGIRAESGRLGGNPKLGAEYDRPGFVYAMRRASDGHIKIGISVNPEKRIYRIRAQHPLDEIDLLAQMHVENMGESEAKIHRAFAAKKLGEWFSLSDAESKDLMEIHLKVNGEQNPTPAFASSSSSSSSKQKQEPREKTVKPSKRAMPDDFGISPAVEAWAVAKGHTRLAEHLESFKAKCRARAYMYVDWDSAFMEAIRGDWAKLGPSAQREVVSPSSRPLK